MVFILYYTFIEVIILLYTFLVISFAPYKECMICRISDTLPASTCASGIGNLSSICLEVNILIHVAKLLLKDVLFLVSISFLEIFCFQSHLGLFVFL